MFTSTKKGLFLAMYMVLAALCTQCTGSTSTVRLYNEQQSHKRQLFDHIAKSTLPSLCQFLSVSEVAASGGNALRVPDDDSDDYTITAYAQCDGNIEEYSIDVKLYRPQDSLNELLCDTLGLFSYEITAGGKGGKRLYLSSSSPIRPSLPRSTWKNVLSDLSDSLTRNQNISLDYIMFTSADMLQDIENILTEVENTKNISDNTYVKWITAPELIQQIKANTSAAGIPADVYLKQLNERLKDLHQITNNYRKAQQELAEQLLSDIERGELSLIEGQEDNDEELFEN